MSDYLKIPKKKIYDLMDLIDLQLKYQQERYMSEKSIELRAVLDTLKFVVDNAKD